MDDFKIYSVSDNYIDYLRAFEPNVYSNKQDRRSPTRKYIGTVLEISQMKYYVPMSSPKGIVDGIRIINQYQEDQDKEDVFKLTRKNVWILVDLGTKICDSESAFGDMIDHLYFLFMRILNTLKI